MRIGTVKQIWRYPVKSMAGEQLDAAQIGNLGVIGDRGWAVRDERKGEITNGKESPGLMQCVATYLESPTFESIPDVTIRLPDQTVLRSDQNDINQRLSEFLGKPVSLWPLQPANNLDHYRRKSTAA